MNDSFNFANTDISLPMTTKMRNVGKLRTSRLGYTTTDNWNGSNRMFSSVNASVEVDSRRTRPFESITRFTVTD
jgi:hypothetical protein